LTTNEARLVGQKRVGPESIAKGEIGRRWSQSLIHHYIGCRRKPEVISVWLGGEVDNVL